jgi:hypothetical protein
MTCPVQTVGRARPDLGRAAGRDFRLSIKHRIFDDDGTSSPFYIHMIAILSTYRTRLIPQAQSLNSTTTNQTLNPQPSTPNPTPFTPNPQSQTCNLQPSTLNLEPCTLDLKAQTLNPKPRTPNPNPFSGGRSIGEQPRDASDHLPLPFRTHTLINAWPLCSWTVVYY